MRRDAKCGALITIARILLDRQHARPDWRHLRCGKRARHTFSIWVLHHSAHKSGGSCLPAHCSGNPHPDPPRQCRSRSCKRAKRDSCSIIRNCVAIHHRGRWLEAFDKINGSLRWDRFDSSRAERRCRRLHGRRVQTRDGLRGTSSPRCRGLEHRFLGEMCVETPKGRFIFSAPVILPSSSPRVSRRN